MKLTVGLIVTAFFAVTVHGAKIYIENATQKAAQEDQIMKITAFPQSVQTLDLLPRR